MYTFSRYNISMNACIHMFTLNVHVYFICIYNQVFGCINTHPNTQMP